MDGQAPPAADDPLEALRQATARRVVLEARLDSAMEGLDAVIRQFGSKVSDPDLTRREVRKLAELESVLDDWKGSVALEARLSLDYTRRGSRRRPVRRSA